MSRRDHTSGNSPCEVGFSLRLLVSVYFWCSLGRTSTAHTSLGSRAAGFRVAAVSVQGLVSS